MCIRVSNARRIEVNRIFRTFSKHTQSPRSVKRSLARNNRNKRRSIALVLFLCLKIFRKSRRRRDEYTERERVSEDVVYLVRSDLVWWIISAQTHPHPNDRVAFESDRRAELNIKCARCVIGPLDIYDMAGVRARSHNWRESVSQRDEMIFFFHNMFFPIVNISRLAEVCNTGKNRLERKTLERVSRERREASALGAVCSLMCVR